MLSQSVVAMCAVLLVWWVVYAHCAVNASASVSLGTPGVDAEHAPTANSKAQPACLVYGVGLFRVGYVWRAAGSRSALWRCALGAAVGRMCTAR